MGCCLNLPQALLHQLSVSRFLASWPLVQAAVVDTETRQAFEDKPADSIAWHIGGAGSVRQACRRGGIHWPVICRQDIRNVGRMFDNCGEADALFYKYKFSSGWPRGLCG